MEFKPILMLPFWKLKNYNFQESNCQFVCQRHTSFLKMSMIISILSLSDGEVNLQQDKLQKL